jgi:hypothetical protein
VLSAGAYAAGFAQLVALVAAALAGAHALRRRLLPGWSGSPAWLATAVIALAIVLWTAQLLGSFGLLEPGLLVGLVLAAGLGLLALNQRGPFPEPISGNGPGNGSRAAVSAAPGPAGLATATRIAGVVVAGVVIAHFSIGTRISLGAGMGGFDTTWYHGPFAAGFAQSGDTFELQRVAPQYLSWFYPQASELVHATGILAFGRDLLSPLLNLGWMAGCLAAAWCIGRPYGVGPLSLVGAAAALGSGVLADQSGEARNDIVATFFLLAATALAVNGWAGRRDGEPPPAGALALAGLAAGLAAGTKVNFLAPAGVLVLAAVAWSGLPRGRALALTGLPALAGGGYWYLRNLAHAGNPLPWIKEIGPVSLPAPAQELGGREPHGVLDYVLEPGVWVDWFGPALQGGLGLLWPLALVGAAAGLLACLGRRVDPGRRIAAVAALAAVGAWLIAPASAEGPQDAPVGFESGLRYLAPALAIGLALLPTAGVLASARRRWALLVLVLALFGFADASGDPWHGRYLATAALAGAVAALGAAALGTGRLRQLPRPALAGGIAAVLAATAIAGYAVQRTYLRERYAAPDFTTPGLGAALAWARDLSGVSIATTATRSYPLWGTDLSNDVRFVGLARPNGGFVRPSSCVAFRRALAQDAPRYVLTALDRFEPGGPRFPREAGWIRGAPGARAILRRAPAVVFELERPPAPAGCPPG